MGGNFRCLRYTRKQKWVRNSEQMTIVKTHLGCYPNWPKSVFQMAFSGTRRSTPNSFFYRIGYDYRWLWPTKNVQPQFRPIRVVVYFIGDLYIIPNGTSNIQKSPVTTKLTTLGHKFLSQNSIRIRLLLNKIFFWSILDSTQDAPHFILVTNDFMWYKLRPTEYLILRLRTKKRTRLKKYGRA